MGQVLGRCVGSRSFVGIGARVEDVERKEEKNKRIKCDRFG